MVLNSNIRKREISKINCLSFHHKKLEKEGQIWFKVSERNKTIKMKMEFNEIKKNQWSFLSNSTINKFYLDWSK